MWMFGEACCRQGSSSDAFSSSLKEEPGGHRAEPGKQEKEGQEEMRPQGSGLIVRGPQATMGTLALSLHQQEKGRYCTRMRSSIFLCIMAALLKWRHIRAGGSSSNGVRGLTDAFQPYQKAGS